MGESVEKGAQEDCNGNVSCVQRRTLFELILATLISSVTSNYIQPTNELTN